MTKTHVARLLLISAAFIALLAHARAQQGTLSAQQIGDIFCIARVSNDMAPVEGLLSPVLAAAIAYAEARNAVIAAENPGEKPPLGDGVPWQAFPDTPGTCTASVVDANSAEPILDIAYFFAGQSTPAWTDKLLLVRQDDALRIYDIAFDKSAESLQGILGAIFSN